MFRKYRTVRYNRFISTLLIWHLLSCAPTAELAVPKTDVPVNYDRSAAVADPAPTESTAAIDWREFFSDSNLTALVETALGNNQELNIFFQELEIARNEVRARSGAYLPSVELGAESGADKVGRYTRLGSVEENLDIAPGKSFPDPLTSYSVGARASWEVDIWKGLRNAEKSAYKKLLSSQEGRKFLVTNLISEIANSYYELCALDSELEIVKQNIKIQKNALNTTKLEKQSARVTELAVRRFDAQVLKTEALQYDLEQKILATENRINFLLGRFPQPIPRSAKGFAATNIHLIQSGVPSELLKNRADIRQAKLDIEAAELDIKVAEAAFYPSLKVTADVGYEAYRLGRFIQTPESLLYGITGGLVGPLINRRAITAEFYNASAKQKQAVLNYERTVLNAFVEAATQVSNIHNLATSAELKKKQVDALTSSIDIAGTLFTSARADYSEVLLTQREAIEARFELVETKLRQMQAAVSLYRALGGGWIGSGK